MKEIERLKLALSKARSVVYEWDTQTGLISWSGDLDDVFKLPDEHKLASKQEYADLVHNDDKDRFISSLETSVHNGGDYRKYYRLKLPNGNIVPIRDRGTVIIKGKKRILLGTLTSHQRPVVVPFKDEKEDRPHTAQEHYKNAQYENALFRTKAVEAYDTANKKGHGEGALLKISIDNLSMMMTWYSISFADRIMEALKSSLGRILRKGDTIHRIAVDQFGIILNNHSQSEAELVIDRIVKKVQLYNNPSFEDPIHLRCSIGSVYFPTYTESCEDALNKAYLALSSARSKSSEFYTDYQDAKKEHLDSKEEFSKVHYLQNAFRDGKIHMAYQPLIIAKTGEVNSYECLLRMEDNEGILSSAGELIPIAEKMGVVDVVDGYVMERIINELRENPQVHLAFNISNLTTDNPKWLKTCTKMLHDPDVASRLTIEITETAAQHDMRQTAYFVAALQALGCKVALDDFGAGYTSFRQLKSLSVDIVKIDGAYIKGLEENSENMLFIKTLLEFNHSYGVETVAECVETGEVAKLLMNAGVDYLQGFYFGKPTTGRPWVQHLADGNAVRE